MFTIWTVLPVSFVTRGKERKRSQQAYKIVFLYRNAEEPISTH